MITDVLKTKFLISIVNELDVEDFDRLSSLHDLALSEEELDQATAKEIDSMYTKYRNKTTEETPTQR